MFQVGQKVVCVEDGWTHKGRISDHFPVKDRVYTVRGFFRAGPDAPLGIRLDELKNEPRQWTDSFGEAAFDVTAFRSLDERKTDISVFTELLVKAKQPEPV
jgi:hypothetical protein